MPAESPPLRADAERNRRRLIEAAAELFARHGIGVGLDQIAKHAGVGVGTAYRRFADKDALLDAVFEDRIAELVGLAEEAAEVEDPWDALAGFLERGLELQTKDRGLRQLVLGAPPGVARATAARERIAPVVARLLERAQAAGVVREDLAVFDVPLLLFTLGSLADLTVDVRPDVWRRVLALFLDGLRPSRTGTGELPVPPLDRAELARTVGTIGMRP